MCGDLGSFIHQKRVEKKITMRKLAGMLDVPVTYLCDVEKNRCRIKDRLAFFIYAIIFNSLNTRSEKYNLLEHIGENKNFILVMGAIFILQTIIIEVGGKVFNTTMLEPKALLVSMALAVLIIPVDLIRKAVVRR